MIKASLQIKTDPSYPIHIGQDLLRSEMLFNHDRRIAIISDTNVAPLYAKPVQDFLQAHDRECHLFVIPAGEPYKTREIKSEIEDQMFAQQLGRDTLIIAIGGGVVTDMAGFIAATYCRGVPVIYIPTSLLAMVDASIGGKTAVNTPAGKNLVGAFKQPQAVLIDIDVLQTLDIDEFSSGMAEVIKHALIKDKNFFDFLKSNAAAICDHDPEVLIAMIKRSCAIKQAIVEQDTHENGIRAILNLGHTIGHALESLSNYQLKHGHAVAQGVLLEGKIAIEQGVMSSDTLDEIKKLFALYAIPHQARHPITEPKLQALMRQDKKSINHQPRYVLLSDIGEVQGLSPALSLDTRAEKYS